MPAKDRIELETSSPQRSVIIWRDTPRRQVVYRGGDTSCWSSHCPTIDSFASSGTMRPRRPAGNNPHHPSRGAIPSRLHFAEVALPEHIFLFSSSGAPRMPETAGRHFLPLVFGAVILLVAMRSPIYFCKNLLLLSSLSCSSLTASILWKIVRRES